MQLATLFLQTSIAGSVSSLSVARTIQIRETNAKKTVGELKPHRKRRLVALND
jgi:hypothetical protein